LKFGAGEDLRRVVSISKERNEWRPLLGWIEKSGCNLQRCETPLWYQGARPPVRGNRCASILLVSIGTPDHKDRSQGNWLYNNRFRCSGNLSLSGCLLRWPLRRRNEPRMAKTIVAGAACRTPIGFRQEIGTTLRPPRIPRREAEPLARGSRGLEPAAEYPLCPSSCP
jgi:hypothetical protein